LGMKLENWPPAGLDKHWSSLGLTNPPVPDTAGGKTTERKLNH
jgi:hypothetical protein